MGPGVELSNEVDGVGQMGDSLSIVTRSVTWSPLSLSTFPSKFCILFPDIAVLSVNVLGTLKATWSPGKLSKNTYNLTSSTGKGLQGTLSHTSSWFSSNLEENAEEEDEEEEK